MEAIPIHVGVAFCFVRQIEGGWLCIVVVMGGLSHGVEHQPVHKARVCEFTPFPVVTPTEFLAAFHGALLEGEP